MSFKNGIRVRVSVGCGLISILSLIHILTFLSLTIGENKVKEYLLDRNVVFENNEVMKIAMIVKKCLKTQISVPYFDDFEIALY